MRIAVFSRPGKRQAAQIDAATKNEGVMRKANWIVAAAALIGGSVGAQAQSPAEFYRGKTINVLIGYTAGGGYDLYARLVARFMGRHIPGNPNVVPQNM